MLFDKRYINSICPILFLGDSMIQCKVRCCKTRKIEFKEFYSGLLLWWNITKSNFVRLIPNRTRATVRCFVFKLNVVSLSGDHFSLKNEEQDQIVWKSINILLYLSRCVFFWENDSFFHRRYALFLQVLWTFFKNPSEGKKDFWDVQHCLSTS